MITPIRPTTPIQSYLFEEALTTCGRQSDVTPLRGGAVGAVDLIVFELRST
jgi:hypothetical protein